MTSVLPSRSSFGHNGTKVKHSLSSDEDEHLSKRPRQSTNGNKSLKEDSESEDDAPLAVVRRTKVEKADESSDSDAPLGAMSATKKAVKQRVSSAPSKSAAKRPPPSESDSDSDVPLRRNGKASTSAKGKPAAKRASVKREATESEEEEEEEEAGESEEEDDDDDDAEASRSGSKKNKGGKIEHTGTGGEKWATLYHTGPRFPPAYEPLPKKIRMKYAGKPVELSPEAEEAALFYAVKLETQHAKDKVFNQNFFEDFQALLKEFPPRDGTKIAKFAECDFRDIYDHWRSIKDAEAAQKKMMAPSQRKKMLEEKKKAEEAMKTCLVDGVEQRVGNVIVEPPALFLGRGEHPKKGRIKRRVPPEAITINHTLGDPSHPPPAPPPGRKWKEVREDRSTTWLAFWIENINGQYKYMYLDATSSFKSNSDRDKFEKARKLDKVVDRLRGNIEKMLGSKQRLERQLGTVVWLIDNYSLRAGNEKGDDEAATYGVCSLLVEHVRKLDDDQKQVKLEFLGKDSMKFKETLNVPERIFKNFKMFTQSTRDSSGDLKLKDKSDEIFDKVNTTDVNKFLQNPTHGGQKGLSAKVFRTYNASTTFQGLLNQTERNLKEAGLTPTVQTLRDQYTQANRLVAILCNHQKSVNPVQNDKAVARFEERLLAVKYERYKERQKLLTNHTAKELKAQFGPKDNDWAKRWSEILKEVDITKDQVKEHEERMITVKKERLQAVFDRSELERKFLAEQAKLEAAGKKKKGVKKGEEPEEDEKKGSKPKTQAEVKAQQKELDETLKELARERKANKSESKTINVASCAKKILGKIAQTEKLLAEQASKEKTSDVSLGTSKLNYIDPRITVAWLKTWDAKVAKLEGKDKVKKEDPSQANKGNKVKKEDPSPAPTKKGAKDGKTTKTADSDRMELDLRVLNLSHYFPTTMQKKFKWAAQEEDGTDLSPAWVFVSNAESKIRDNMSSARRKGGAGADSDDDEAIAAEAGVVQDAVDSKDVVEAQKAIAAAKVKKTKIKKET